MSQVTITSDRVKLIVDLNPITPPLNGYELIAVVQGGVTSKATIIDIGNYTKTLDYSTWVYSHSSVYATVSSLSSNWNSVYATVLPLSTLFSQQSANNLLVYSNVAANSANWNSVYNTVIPLSTLFSQQSANNLSVYSLVNSDSANWNSVYNTVMPLSTLFGQQSAKNLSVYSTLNSESANNISVYSYINSISANNAAVNSTVNSASANWNAATTCVNSNATNWNNTYSCVNSNATNWDNTYSCVNTYAPNWNAATTCVNSNANNWNTAYNCIPYNVVTNYSGSGNTQTLQGNLTVLGTISAKGGISNQTVNVGTTSSFNVENINPAVPAILVKQASGSNAQYGIATFFDGLPALYIGKATNNDGSIYNGGVIGIKTSTPNKTLTILGDVSASAQVWATTFNGNLNGNATTVTNGIYNTDSGTVTNTMLAGSIASNKITNGSNWDATTTCVNSNAISWNNASNCVNSNATGWSNASNCVNSNATGWNSNYTLTNNNSANWNAAYTSVNTNATNWNNTYSCVNSNATNWNNATNCVNTNATGWSNATTCVNNNATNWNSNYTFTNNNSANWNNVYNCVLGTSNCSSAWNCTATIYTKTATNNNIYPVNGGNSILAGSCSTISGGCNNTSQGTTSIISSGFTNKINNGAFNSVINGGNNNTINNSSSNSVIGGGCYNCVYGLNTFVAAGSGNNDNNQNNTFILGSNLRAYLPNYTYVNNLSSQNIINTTNLYSNLLDTNATSLQINSLNSVNTIVNPNGGNVGIGTQTPTSLLTVNGDTTIIGTLYSNNVPYTYYLGSDGSTIPFVGGNFFNDLSIPLKPNKTYIIECEIYYNFTYSGSPTQHCVQYSLNRTNIDGSFASAFGTYMQTASTGITGGNVTDNGTGIIGATYPGIPNVSVVDLNITPNLTKDVVHYASLKFFVTNGASSTSWGVYISPYASAPNLTASVTPKAGSYYRITQIS
jgi:hypothetical protein